MVKINTEAQQGWRNWRDQVPSFLLFFRVFCRVPGLFFLIVAAA
jgi:hypothetical protein